MNSALFLRTVSLPEKSLTATLSSATGSCEVEASGTVEDWIAGSELGSSGWDGSSEACAGTSVGAGTSPDGKAVSSAATGNAVSSTTGAAVSSITATSGSINVMALLGTRATSSSVNPGAFACERRPKVTSVPKNCVSTPASTKSTTTPNTTHSH